MGVVGFLALLMALAVVGGAIIGAEDLRSRGEVARPDPDSTQAREGD